MEISAPGSVTEINLERKNKKMRFRRIFVALKPSVDGFLASCRPYIGVDATKLNGKYTGQLASATGCITWLMQFLTQRQRRTGPGLWNSCKGMLGPRGTGHLYRCL